MSGMTNVGTLAEMLVLKQTIKEMGQALRFYADAKNYIRPDHEWETNPIEKDEGDRARAVLRKVGQDA